MNVTVAEALECQARGCEAWTCDHGDHVATHLTHVEDCPNKTAQSGEAGAVGRTAQQEEQA